MESLRRTVSGPAVLETSNSTQRSTETEGPTTAVGAGLLCFKAIVGAGLFALPFAYKLMGIGGATIAMVIIGLITFYSGVVLIRVHNVVMRDTLRRDVTFVSLTEHCFGTCIAKTVFVLLVLTTLGACGAYIVFIASVLQSLWPAYSLTFFSGVTAAAVVPFLLVRNHHMLVWSSSIGNVAVAFVVIATLVQGAELVVWQPMSSYLSFESSTFMEVFGIVGFLYAISPTLLTIEKSMGSQRRHFVIAYLVATVVVMVGCCAYGLINYLYFGDSTCSIIMLNLSRGPLAAAAKLGIAADLFLSFPITLAAAREAIELSAFAKNTQWRCLKQSGVSVALICGSYVFTFIPSFSVIVNVVGGWSVALFCFVLPPRMLLNLRPFHSSAILHLMSSEDTNHRAADEKTPLPRHSLHPTSFHPVSAQIQARNDNAGAHGHRAPAVTVKTHDVLALPLWFNRFPVLFPVFLSTHNVGSDLNILHDNSTSRGFGKRERAHSLTQVMSSASGKHPPRLPDAATAIVSCAISTSIDVLETGARVEVESTVPVVSVNQLPVASTFRSALAHLHTIDPRHEIALGLMGIGSYAEKVFLILLVIFGVATLLLTTVQSAASLSGSTDRCAVGSTFD